MATEAFQRLKNENWLAGKFVEFIQELHPQINSAIEIKTNEKFSLIFLNENTIEIATCATDNSATLQVNIESIPVTEIKNINLQFDSYLAHPDERVQTEIIPFKVVISFKNREDLIIDITNSGRGVRYKIKDLHDLINNLKKRI